MGPILRLNKISKRFGGVVAAQDVTFSVQPGEIHGLIGPNGAGKSTLMNLISGIYAPDSGEIFFKEGSITQLPPYSRARMGIGRTFQVPRFMQRSNIKDNLLLGIDLGSEQGYLKSFIGKMKNDIEIELQELMDLISFRFNWDDDITGIPFGQRKIMEIIRSMLAYPKVMLVDEPAAGLNSKEIEDVLRLLNYASKQRGIGVLLIEHSMDLVMNICKEIVVINFGKVISTGTPAQVSVDKGVIEAYLGEEYKDA